jgi:hypothetical protein
VSDDDTFEWYHMNLTKEVENGHAFAYKRRGGKEIDTDFASDRLGIKWNKKSNIGKAAFNQGHIQ